MTFPPKRSPDAHSPIRGRCPMLGGHAALWHLAVACRTWKVARATVQAAISRVDDVSSAVTARAVGEPVNIRSPGFGTRQGVIRSPDVAGRRSAGRRVDGPARAGAGR